VNVFSFADVEDSSVAEHSGSAGRLLDVVIAVEVEQASNAKFCEV
jgi:hypothetical protein